MASLKTPPPTEVLATLRAARRLGHLASITLCSGAFQRFPATALSAALKPASGVVTLSGRPSCQKDSRANAQSVSSSPLLRVRVRATG